MKFEHALIFYSIIVVMLAGLWLARELFNFQQFNLWLTLAYFVAFFLVFLWGSDALLGDHKLNRRKFLLLTASMVTIGVTIVYST